MKMHVWCGMNIECDMSEISRVNIDVTEYEIS